jgi:surfactin synthase thioesterase subunit
MTDEYAPEVLEKANAEMRAAYAKLSDAKLAKKIRHLKGAVGRCTQNRNAMMILGFLDIAIAEAYRRRKPEPADA